MFDKRISDLSSADMAALRALSAHHIAIQSALRELAPTQKQQVRRRIINVIPDGDGLLLEVEETRRRWLRLADATVVDGGFSVTPADDGTIEIEEL